MNTIERSIPKHLKGLRKEHSSARKFVSREDASLCYDHAIARLLNINHWDLISPAAKGAFQLMSGNRKLQRRKAKLGDYVRIGLPAPENPEGNGFDWVKVDTLKFSSGRRKEQCLLTLVPCPMPGGEETAHFFSGNSSSSFLLTRDGRMVSAEYYGHNETPNTEVSGFREKLRNIIVAAGAIIGFSDTLWKPLTEGLLMDGAKLRADIVNER